MKSKSTLENISQIKAEPSSRTASSLLQPDEPFFLVSSRRRISQQLAKQCTADTPTVQSKIVMTPIGQELIDADWCDEITMVMPDKKLKELQKELKKLSLASAQNPVQKTRDTLPSMKCVKEHVPSRQDPVIEIITL